MAITLYEKTSDALVPSGERTVATYESGLVRVDQTYICTHAAAATHRAAFVTLAIGGNMPDGNTTPAIDGMYIHPTPQEVIRQDGFTEFRVSAYGRISETVQNFSMQQEIVRNNIYQYSVWNVTGSIVTRSGTELSIATLVNANELLFEPFGFAFKDGEYQPTQITKISENYRFSRYQVGYSKNGVIVNVLYQFDVYKPDLVITAARAFGEFTEFDLAMERPIPEETPTAPQDNP